MAPRSSSLPSLPPHALVPATGAPSFVVATIDPEGRPSTTFMTWVAVRDERTLRLCIDTRSSTFRNLSKRPEMAVELLADGLVFGVKGVARVVKPLMDSTPFPCALVELVMDEARDHGAPGTVFKGPTYAYTDDKAHRHDLERRMFDELMAD